jgi:SAM-dependent methyltransferase
MYNRFTLERILGRVFETAQRLPALKGVGDGRFLCPVCEFRGPFINVKHREHARCPKCRALERHRIQKLVLDSLQSRFGFSDAECIQFAPDVITPVLRDRCRKVVTADINPKPGSIRLDMRKMDLPTASFDVLYASHVLEHILEDADALAEIRRVVRPGGIAILPVPIVAEKTVEYSVPRPSEEYHVRAPGLDYFDKYRAVFGRVDVYRSGQFPAEYQTWICDARTGKKHEDAVPVCFISP